MVLGSKESVSDTLLNTHTGETNTGLCQFLEGAHHSLISEVVGECLRPLTAGREKGLTWKGGRKGNEGEREGEEKRDRERGKERGRERMRKEGGAGGGGEEEGVKTGSMTHDNSCTIFGAGPSITGWGGGEGSQYEH